MRRALPIGLLAVLAAASQARGGDFTGAYAGVHAGYAFERERGSKTPGARPEMVAPSAAASAAQTDLPPSAAVAAKSLQQRAPSAR